MATVFNRKDERKLKKVQDTTKPSKSDTGGKLETNFYVPKDSEYKQRAKDIPNKAKRIQTQYNKGLLQDAPGVKTEKGKEYVKQLEDLTGEKQDKIGTYITLLLL